MRVFTRTVLGLSLLVLVPAGAYAGPILNGLLSASCAGIVPNGSNCTLATVDAAAGTPLTGEFQFDSDVALFQFLLTGETAFSAFTTSYETNGFDSTLGLFDAGGTIVTYADPSGSGALFTARGSDVNPDPGAPDYDDFLPQIVLPGGTYYLALLQFPNDFSLDVESGLDSLAAGFARDDPALASACLQGCGFELHLSAAPAEVPAPVPEPGTLSLMAIGAGAALVRRRWASRAAGRRAP